MSGGVTSRRTAVLRGSSASIMGLRRIVRLRRAHLKVPLSRVKVWWIELWLWPAARMDISTNLPMSDQGDFEADESFSASMWVNLRLKPANQATGNAHLHTR